MKFPVFAIICLLLVAAPSAQAQQGLNLGGILQLDNDRLEAAPGASFSMAVYTGPPPVEGLDNPDLVGLFSSTLGQYPVTYRGTWLKIIVHPGGFKNLQGVDFDPTGHLARDAKDGWQALRPERGGGYSLVVRADEIGAIPLRFRIRHRDGRDRFTLLIFSATWTRGGNLPTALEVMIQREPAVPLRGEAALPYLRGFIPATAQAEGRGMQQQAVEVPPQTAIQTLPDRPPLQQGPPLQHEQSVSWPTVKVGAYQTDIVLRFDPQGYSSEERQLVERARQNIFEPQVSDVLLARHRRGVVLIFEDTQPFEIEAHRDGRSMKIDVKPVGGGIFQAVAWGTNELLVGGTLINIRDANGRLRTISFAWQQ